jgi:glycosyltransferase involved in cell wall biosynthesis
MIQSLKLDPEKVVYIPNYIDIPKNYFPNLSELESNQLLFVWRLSKEKWIDVSIKAIKTILQTNPNLIIKYEIIWDWPEKYNLENLISNLWLKDYVNLLGRIDNTILKKYYEKSWIIIMPSVWLENNPIVALEAMKSWRPIIASNIGWFPDLIEDGKNGYLFKVWNHIDLAEKIQKLIWNQEKIIQMWSYGFEKVKSEYNSELFFNKLLSLYMKD